MAESRLALIVETKGGSKLNRLKGDADKVEKEFAQLQNRLPKVERGIKNTGAAATTASRGIRTLTGAVRGLVTAYAAIQVGKFILGNTATLETQTKSLQVLTGELETAKNIIAELQAFGAVTPFTSTQLIDTAKRLKAFGVETEDLVKTTQQLADVAGATGAELNGVATAYGQIQAKGKLQTEELLQLQERGIDLATELKKQYNLTGQEFSDALRKGQISAEAVAFALDNVTSKGGKYANGAIAQSETLAGKFSTLEDGIQRIAQKLGEVLAPALKGVLDLANQAVASINQALAAGSITDQDKQGFKQQAEAEVRRFAGPLPGGPFGAGEIVVRTNGKTYKGPASSVVSQITNDLINREVQNRANALTSSSAVTPAVTPTPTLPPLLGGNGNGENGSKATKNLLSLVDQQQLAVKNSEALLKNQQAFEAAILAGDKALAQKLQTEREFIPLLNEISVLESAINKTIGDNDALLAQGIEQAQIDNRLQEAKNQLLILQNKLLDKQSALRSKAAQDLIQAGGDIGAELAGKKVKEVKEEATLLDKTFESVGQTVKSGLVDGITAAIDGAKDLQAIFADMLKSIGRLLINAGLSSLGGKGGLFGAGGIPGFADGGVAGAGQTALVGEKGPEIIVPLKPSLIVPNDPFGEAAAAITSPAGTTPDPFAATESVMGSAAQVMQAEAAQRQASAMAQSDSTMTIQTQVINSVEYATVDQVQAASAAAAKTARARVFGELKNNPSRRGGIGL